LAEQFDLHGNQIVEWKKQLQEHAASVFGSSEPQSEPTDLKPLHAKIGQLTSASAFTTFTANSRTSVPTTLSTKSIRIFCMV
jgi:transposase-like protein